jgi:uncharacterized membrane protein
MEAKPKINVPPTPADKAIALVAWAALALLWGLTLWSFYALPATIPTHFNGAGTPDRYGTKSSLLLLPVLASVLFAAMTAIGAAFRRHPHALNYPVAITPANALGQYRGAIRVMSGLKTALVLVLLGLVFQTGQVATGQAPGLGAWNMPGALGLLFGLPMSYYAASVAKDRR